MNRALAARFAPSAWFPPLLAKDLIEIAARRRTYIVRVAAAALIVVVFLIQFASQLSRSQLSGTSVIGSGAGLIEMLVLALWCGIHLILPALIAPAIPLEEERGNLELMEVSGISLRSLLLSTLWSRLISMASLLLVGLPLAGLAYALGGVTVDTVIAAAIVLTATMLQVGCWSLCCTVTGKTPLRATLTAYLKGLFVLNVVAPLALSLFSWLLSLLVHRDVSAYPLLIFFETANRGRAWWDALIGCVPVLVIAGWYYFKALRLLRDRQASQQNARVRAFYRARSESLQRERLEREAQQQTGAVTRPSDTAVSVLPRWTRRRAADVLSRALPNDRPLAWRESRYAPFASRDRSGIYAVIVPFAPLCLWIDLSAMFSGGRGHAFLCSIAGLIVMALAALATGLMAANLFAVERARSTMDLLLLTPLTSREVITQKQYRVLPMLRTAIAVIALMLGIDWLLECIRLSERWVCGMPFALVAWTLYLHVALWLGTIVGLRLRGQMTTFMVMLGALIGLPVLLSVAADAAHAWMFDLGPQHWWPEALSPVHMIGQMLFGTDRDTGPWFAPQVLHLVLLLALWWGLRAWCLRRADAWLGRA